MTLNNIELNSTLLREMYRNSLVEVGDKTHRKVLTELPPIEVIKKKDPEHEWKYLGEFKKNILMIVRYPTVTYLPDEQLNFLTSILIACKLSLGDVAIVNILNAPPAFYKDAMEKFRSTTTILFGITPQEFEMPVNFPEFQVQRFNNCTFLHTPGLESLEADKVLKSKLWVCLRRMFSLS